MITTQRLIMIILAFNLVVGLAQTIYNTPSYSDGYMETEIAYYQDRTEGYDSEDSLKSGSETANLETERTVGNSLTWSRTIVRVFWYGLNPMSIRASDVDTQLEKQGIHAIQLLRWFMYILIMVEVFMLLKNKKQS